MKQKKLIKALAVSAVTVTGLTGCIGKPVNVYGGIEPDPDPYVETMLESEYDPEDDDIVEVYGPFEDVEVDVIEETYDPEEDVPKLMYGVPETFE